MYDTLLQVTILFVQRCMCMSTVYLQFFLKLIHDIISLLCCICCLESLSLYLIDLFKFLLKLLLLINLLPLYSHFYSYKIVFHRFYLFSGRFISVVFFL